MVVFQTIAGSAHLSRSYICPLRRSYQQKRATKRLMLPSLEFDGLQLQGVALSVQILAKFHHVKKNERCGVRLEEMEVVGGGWWWWRMVKAGIDEGVLQILIILCMCSLIVCVCVYVLEKR